MNAQRICIAVTFIITVTISAQTPEEAVHFLENESGVGVRAQAMGNSYVGLANDYTAIYWNPAGLTQLKNSEFTGSFYHMIFNNEANFAENTVLENQSYTKLKSVGLAYKFPTSRGSLVLGFGYHRFKDYDDFLIFNGFNTQSNRLEFELEDESGETGLYPFDRDVLQTEQVDQEGNLSSWSIGGGIAMSPNFSLGMAVNFYSGSSQYGLDLYQDDIDDVYYQFPANFNSYELHESILSQFSGCGVKLGGLFELNRDIRIGIAVDLPTKLKVLETYSSHDVLTFDDEFISEMDLGKGEWEYVVKYPIKFSGGISLDLKQLLITTSFEYRDWTQVRFDVPSGYDLNDDYNDLLMENHYFNDTFRPVFSYVGGGEFRVPGTGLKLRGGYRVVPSPFIDAEKSLDRRYMSGGFGYDIDRNTSLNFSYTRGLWERDSIDSYTPGGTHESIQTHRILAGITYRF